MENNSPPTNDDGIDLFEFLGTIWSGRWLIASIVGVFTLGGIAYALTAQEWYRAEVVLAPVSQQSAAGGALAGLGGLAGLVGIPIPSAGGQNSIAVLKSKDFARDFIGDLNLMPVLLKGSSTSSKPLDIRDAVEVFDRSIRSVSENTRSRLVTLSIRWKDPDTAALWANTLAKRLNDRLRDQSAAEAERNVTYLRKEMAATSVVSLQQSIGSMLEAEMQKLMLARGNEEFALKVIDRAQSPKNRVAPRRSMIVLVSFFAGGLLSIILVIGRRAIQNRSRK